MVFYFDMTIIIIVISKKQKTTAILWVSDSKNTSFVVNVHSHHNNDQCCHDHDCYQQTNAHSQLKVECAISYKLKYIMSRADNNAQCYTVNVQALMQSDRHKFIHQVWLTSIRVARLRDTGGKPQDRICYNIMIINIDTINFNSIKRFVRVSVYCTTYIL